VYQVTRSINAPATGDQRTHRSVGLAGEVVEAARSTATPIVAFTSTSGGVVDPRVVEVLEGGAVPLLLGLESGLSAIGSAIKYAAFLRQPVSEAARDWSKPDVGRLLAMLQRDGALSEFDSKQVLTDYGVPVVEGGLAFTLEEAERIASRLGYPVAMKARGVDDTILRLAPVDEDAAIAMLAETRTGRLLTGFRGQPPRNIQAAASIVVRVSQLICDLEDAVGEIDLNPLIVHERGAVVVDALVNGRGTTGVRHA